MSILLMEHLFREVCNTNTNLLFETILLDESKLDTLYDKYYHNIPREEFERIASADVVTTNMSRGKLGMYAKWLLKLYQDNNLNLNELDKAKEYLPIFDRVAKADRITPEQKNLHKINSLSEMGSIIQPFLDGEEATSKGEEIRQLKDEGAKKIYEDGRFLVIQPLTEKASCHYGSNSKWCTAATEAENLFDVYHKQGPLYIIIDKSNNEKYQFHYERGEYRYSNNNYIDFSKNTELLPILGKLSPDETIKINIDGKWGFIDKDGNWLLEPEYNKIGSVESDGSRKVELKGDEGLIDENGNWILEPKYNKIGEIETDGSRVVKLNSYSDIYGLLGKNGNWILEPKYNKIGEIESDGNRVIELEYYNGLLGKNGNWILEPKHRKIWEIESDGRRNVELEVNKHGLLDKNGNWILEPKYRALGHMEKSGYRKAELDSGYGLMGKNLEWILEPKYNWMGNVEKSGYRRVKVNDKWGLMDENLNWLLEPKYDDLWELDKYGKRRVKLNGKYGLMDENLNWALEPKCDWVDTPDRYGERIVKLNGKMGLMGDNLEWILEPKYDEISNYDMNWDTDELIRRIILNGKKQTYFVKTGEIT